MAWAGVFNEKVEIYDLVKSKNEYGIITEERELTYTTRAKVGHVSGSRSVINSEITTPYIKNFVLRIYVPLKDDSWIKYEDKYYRVTSINKNKELQQQVITGEIVEE
jgi:hypothetical protein